jgi:hypothetical protein
MQEKHRNSMNRERAFPLTVPLLLSVLMLTTAYASGGKSTGDTRSGIKRPAGVPHSTLLNINNVAMWANDNGSLERRTQAPLAGVTFPRGTTTCVYAGGLLWGGYVGQGSNRELCVGGQTYTAGTLPGRIIAPGVAENPDNPDVRIYRVRRDWQTANLTQDAAEFFGKAVEDVTNGDIAALREQYRQDWVNWPWQKGAPYYNRDGIQGYQPAPDGSYDSTRDEPGLAGADEVLWLVCNDLDANTVSALTASSPIGLELQITCWAYSHTSNLSNVIFQRYRLIYKGTATTPATSIIDSMYLAKWVDPDIGDNGDDFAGCLPDRNIGYAYNSSATDVVYSSYNLPPPVVGYALLQGPVIPQPGSTARKNFSSLRDHANLPMTSFAYFATGGLMTDPSTSASRGSWWTVLRGKCYTDPISGKCTKFPLSGDPSTLNGWVDGRVDPAGDRKFLISSGPFRMALGDTQEVVVGLMCAEGTNNLDGITAMEHIDDGAQDLLNFDFVAPSPVPVPDFRIVELSNKFIFDWESDTATTHQIEHFNSQGYKFETYKVYQFRGPALTDPCVLFPPFNITKPRSLQVTTDLLRNYSLVNGQKYYYAITAVAYNPDSSVYEKRLESAVVIKLAVPHSPNPGTIYPYYPGDTVSNIHMIAGLDDGIVRAIYYDPLKADGHAYEVWYHRPYLNYKPTWDFIDTTASDTLLRRMTMGLPPIRILTRGFTLEVKEPLFGFKNVMQTEYAFKPANDVVFNAANPQGNYMILGGGTSGLDTIVGYTTNDQDLEWRFTGDSSWAAWIEDDPLASKWIRVPYTMWQMDRTGKLQGRQVYTFITDHAQDNTWHPGVLLDREYNGKPISVFYPVSAYVDSVEENLHWYARQYNDSIPWAPDGFLVRALLYAVSWDRSRAELWKAYIADLDGDGIPAPKGTIVRFVQNKQIRDNDKVLVTPGCVVTDDVAAARAEVQKVNVFPNPYYGLNRAELDRSQRFITFNHLPRYATIRIINLSGVMVKTIHKDDGTQFATWDLNNENALPVASGIYLADVEMRDVNSVDLGSKILKLMIVQEQRFIQTR